MQPKTIAIIGAMDCEIELLKNLIDNPKNIIFGKFHFISGKICGQNVVVAKSGVGKACAASYTQLIADKFSPEYIINTGVAGGAAEELAIGDFVIGTELVQHDFDVTALGYAKGYTCTGINPDKPTVFCSDKKLIQFFENAAFKVLDKSKIHKGIIASGDTFVANVEKKKEIRQMFNAVAVEMEGAAIAQTAYLNDIPFVIVRAISDLADGSATDFQSDFEQKTAKISALVIKSLLENFLQEGEGL